MRKLILLTLITLTISYSVIGQSLSHLKKFHNNLPGNSIIEFIKDTTDSSFYLDPVNDTINYKHWQDNIYVDTLNKVYILTQTFYPINSDTLLNLQYYRNYSDFFDLKTYKKIANGFFINKINVYTWWVNSDGEYPVKIDGADPNTFIPFDSTWGGRDKEHVFCGDPIGGFKIIKGATPKYVNGFKPTREDCWSDCYYFIDDKNVYFGSQLLTGSDSKSFRMVNSETIDAEDKFQKYFNGRIIKK